MHLMIIALLATVLACLWLGRRKRAKVEFANIGEGTHDSGNMTKAADAAIATRFLIVKHGSDVNHVTPATAAGNSLLGICTDEAEAAEDLVNVAVIGAAKGTLKVTAGGVIAVDDLLTTDANGKAVAAGAGNKIIGKALQAGVANDVIEFAPAGAGAVAP